MLDGSITLNFGLFLGFAFIYLILGSSLVIFSDEYVDPTLLEKVEFGGQKSDLQ